MVARAIFSFQAQNNRELSFKKGDVIYIKKQVWRNILDGIGRLIVTFQVDSNWYEGERNAMLGIFPTTYVEIIPQDAVASQVLLVITEDDSCHNWECLSNIFAHQVSTLSKKERNMDGAAKAKFNFTAQTPMEVSFLKGKWMPHIVRWLVILSFRRICCSNTTHRQKLVWRPGKLQPRWYVEYEGSLTGDWDIRWGAARVSCRWLTWKSWLSLEREPCLLQLNLLLLLLHTPSSRFTSFFFSKFSNIIN